MKISLLFSVSALLGAVIAIPVNGSRPEVTIDDVRGNIPEDAVLGFLDLSDVEGLAVRPIQTEERTGLLFVNRQLAEKGTEAASSQGSPKLEKDIARVYKRLMEYGHRRIFPAIDL
ncbi:AFL062Wp [Eremothecium gossypii ATCC 10895]|uniref:AFL062Wp n=1 Tax=Eremothecium gossypii (strain ATCC 10895 / CBS 109.51 / FGSC 9923 / NRRL Y-1056) TaxID=284811 RepID=Q754X8_EREGS|nr:AFL062Wp [Eremothecium gossypii ATCC 10895]AAS53310.1 AFL062Wp [Eremothecium gossypii ATCC 10895]AEY97621.1 FAFL062Wp [Eremothecium gossypii FDAG1]